MDLPFYDVGNSTLEALFIEENHTSLQEEFERPSSSDSADNARLESLRSTNDKELLICHLNINSIHSKFEELTATINKISAHKVFVSETKIGAGYPDEQFSIPGHVLYRNDRKKGGGGIMVLVSSVLSDKRLKPDKHDRKLELIALEIKTDFGNIIILGVYHPPRSVCGDYRYILKTNSVTSVTGPTSKATL